MLQVRPQWFVRMEPLAKPALEAVAAGDVRIVPERFEKVYNRWLGNIRVRCPYSALNIVDDNFTVSLPGGTYQMRPLACRSRSDESVLRSVAATARVLLIASGRVTDTGHSSEEGNTSSSVQALSVRSRLRSASSSERHSATGSPMADNPVRRPAVQAFFYWTTIAIAEASFKQECLVAACRTGVYRGSSGGATGFLCGTCSLTRRRQRRLPPACQMTMLWRATRQRPCWQRNKGISGLCHRLFFESNWTSTQPATSSSRVSDKETCRMQFLMKPMPVQIDPSEGCGDHGSNTI